ncbi:hypothetical protein H4R34_004098, partial [Dimargaris verticillata]
VRFPTAGAESGEQCALQAPAPFSTLGDQADQPVCFQITVDESAQNLCDSPQPEVKVPVVVVNEKITTDVQPNVEELDGPQSTQVLAKKLRKYKTAIIFLT